MLLSVEEERMLDTTACALASEVSQNSATLLFLLVFSLFVGVDSVVNALALFKTLNNWNNAAAVPK